MTVMPRDREWTVDDLARTPDDGLRYELVDGVLLVSAAPSTMHQIVVVELVSLLRSCCPDEARALVAPTDYQPTRTRSLQPVGRPAPQAGPVRAERRRGVLGGRPACPLGPGLGAQCCVVPRWRTSRRDRPAVEGNQWLVGSA